MACAELIEIFSSLQGEGPYAGEAMTFLRLAHCALACQFCDTPASFVDQPTFRMETPPRSAKFIIEKNPVEPSTLASYLENFPPQEVLSVTGGEPLQQVTFLQEWLPLAQQKRRILLETNGVLPQALAKVINHVDIVSMDLKLPSVTGMRAYWEEHEAFLKIAVKKEVYVKVVLSEDLIEADLKRALDLVQAVAPQIAFILQPMTPQAAYARPISRERLKNCYEFSQNVLPQVKVLPQLHPMLGIL